MDTMQEIMGTNLLASKVPEMVNFRPVLEIYVLIS